MALLPILLSSALAAAAPGPAAGVPRELTACGDAAGFPPYTFQGAAKVDGYNIAYLEAILAPLGRTIKVTLLSWKRCLLLAEQGQYDIVLDVGDILQRRQQFRLIQSHYSVTPILMYSKEHPLAPLKSRDELAPLSRCQVRGWDFSYSGTSQSSELITHPSNVTAGFAMLRYGRCRVMLYQLELLRSQQGAPGEDISQGIAYQLLPWRKASRMHFGVSRQVAYAKALGDMLDVGVERLQQSGQGGRLLQQYLPK